MEGRESAADAAEVARLAEEAMAEGGLDKTRLERLVEAPLEALCTQADRIRERCCGDVFEICSIMNVKSGRCSEDCKYCAQSKWWNAEVACYPFAGEDEIFAQGKRDAESGSRRFSLVASGTRVGEADVERACAAARRLREETDAQVCVSFGLLSQDSFAKLREAGVTRVHNNLETSRSHFSRICTTHAFDQKLKALADARDAGMQVCSGGIVGMGETWEDRIDMALTLQGLRVSSVPINVLNPIPGTPLQGMEPLSADEVRRVFAIFRFALPCAFLRLAGGRALLPDAGRALLRSGANAAISGDMLTTAGFDIRSDVEMVRQEGFRPARADERTAE